MKFFEKLKKSGRSQIWREYCGFLDLSLSDYMYIQDRLMEEQIRRWKASGLGKQLLRGRDPITPDEFRRIMPLTSYHDYADILLPQKKESLPSEPICWIQTTWEGGLRPIKLAPYSREMLDVYKHNIISVTMLASSRSKGHFSLRPKDRVLYGGAPLPYATGLLPSLISEDVTLSWLPDDDASSGLSFSQRIKEGFKMGLHGGIDFFFAIGSVANYITENFGSATGSGSKGILRPKVVYRYLRGKYIARRDGRSLMPGDIFDIKGFVCAGTDSCRYKESLAKAWGVRPIEIAAGTEDGCIAAETWEQRGMVFFPDACFYEFIPEEEMLRNMEDPDYQPRTCLMDEVHAGEIYELVISVLHGGAFMRYRIGDTYRCVSAAAGELPHFTFQDRVPSVIDIAGFTRLTEASISEVIRLSKLGIGDWIANKEFDCCNRPYLHMYLEMTPDALENDAISRQVLTDHLSAYFRYFDSDYSDLKKLLGIEPLQITFLKYGTIAAYRRRGLHRLSRVNPQDLDLHELLQSQELASGSMGGGVRSE